MPQLLYPRGKGPWWALDKRLGEPRLYGEEKMLLLPEFELLTLQSSNSQLVAVLTALSWIISIDFTLDKFSTVVI
jgi:hypothetical protein